jgi:hypothetical protein
MERYREEVAPCVCLDTPQHPGNDIKLVTSSRWPEVEMLFPHTPSGREPLLVRGERLSRHHPETLYRLPNIFEFTSF